MKHPTSLAEGRYLLVEQLGEGGMATVYRAFDQRLQVWRAVKILLPDYAGKKKIRKRFEAEAQTMALLEHPNIVRVYDVGSEGNCAYIVMELLLGGCLVDWLEAHGPMPPRMAVQATIETCEGLAAAHAKGVIHRDIKPHNVMVTQSGLCRVTDFGIARVGDSETSMTKTGSVMGTWGYMAPEQRTNAKGVDVRADVYAVGATLYSLLADRMPMDLFAAERDSSILEGIHESLVPIIVKASEYNREDRHDTVLQLRDELLAVLPGLPEIPEGTPPLAVFSAGNPAPPDPTQYEVSSESANPQGAAGATILPGVQGAGGTDPAPTILPDEDAAGHPTILSPDESAVTMPGAVSRHSKPPNGGVSHSSAAETQLHDPMAVPIAHKASPPVESGSTARAALFGATAMVWLIGGLIAILVGIVVLYQLVLKPRPEDPGLPQVPVPEQPVPDPDPDPSPDPSPEPEPVPRPDSVPQPTPGPVSSKPVPAQPAPVRPAPVQPAPIQPAPVPVEVAPVPAPAAAPCVDGKPALVTGAQKIKFVATWCGEGPLDKSLRIVAHYRKLDGSGAFLRKEMALFNKKWVASIEGSNPDFAAGVEYYIDGWGGSYGSSSKPKKMPIP